VLQYLQAHNEAEERKYETTTLEDVSPAVQHLTLTTGWFENFYSCTHESYRSSLIRQIREMEMGARMVTLTNFNRFTSLKDLSTFDSMSISVLEMAWDKVKENITKFRTDISSNPPHKGHFGA
jgi:hypothetical protein